MVDKIQSISSSYRNSPKVFQSIQLLRFEAALLVVLTHVFDRLTRHGVFSQETGSWLGHVGVSAFFVISGFIISTTINDAPQGLVQSGRFFWRRFTRIAPTYYILTIFLMLKQFFVDSRLETVQAVILSLLFIPYRNDAGIMQPIYGLGWSLNMEMYFYLIVAISMIIPVNREVTIIALVATPSLLLALLPDRQGAVWDALGFFGQPSIWFFISGILISRLRMLGRGRLSVSTALVASTALLTSAAIAILMDARLWIVGVIAAILIASLEILKNPETSFQKIGIYLGDASYSIYLTHSFVLGPLFAVWMILFQPNFVTLTLLLITSVVASACVGSLFNTFIERPIGSLLKKSAPRSYTVSPVRVERS